MNKKSEAIKNIIKTLVTWVALMTWIFKGDEIRNKVVTIIRTFIKKDSDTQKLEEDDSALDLTEAYKDEIYEEIPREEKEKILGRLIIGKSPKRYDKSVPLKTEWPSFYEEDGFNIDHNQETDNQ